MENKVIAFINTHTYTLSLTNEFVSFKACHTKKNIKRESHTLTPTNDEKQQQK